MSQILLVNNEQSTLNILTKLLKTEGYKVVSTTDVEKAAGLIRSDPPTLMILGAGAKCDADLKLLTQARQEKPSMPVISLRDAGNEELSQRVSALKPFASLEKPLKVDQLLTMVQKAVDYEATPVTQDVNLNLQMETVYQFENIVAESPAMRSVCDMISRVATTDVAVLLIGEPGTGSEVMAETMHRNSKRATKQFVAIQCDSPTAEKDLFGDVNVLPGLSKALAGTLFLHRLDRLARFIQDELARSLQNHSFKNKSNGQNSPLDVRLIASVNANLEKQVKQGSFSADLYKHVRTIPIRIPALRERKQDILPTVRQVLQQKLSGQKMLPVFQQDVLDILENHTWPGNLTEVDSVVEEILKNLKGSQIAMECLPLDLRTKPKVL